MPEMHPAEHDPYDVVAGEWMSPEFLDLRKPAVPTFAELLLEDAPKMPTREIPGHLRDLLGLVDFEEREAKWKVAESFRGLVRHVPGVSKPETYADKLRSVEARTGKTEAASVGFATFGDQPAVMYCMDWEFFAGSLGVVAGKKFQLAVDLAIKHKLPLVSVYSSSGVRQQENYAGLVQMPAMVNGILRYKRATNQPHVALLLGMVMGGISAGPVPQADAIYAVSGTDYGFAGPRVIEAYEGKAIEPNAQRAEAHAVRRSIDVVVQDTTEFVDCMTNLFALSRPHVAPPRPVEANELAASNEVEAETAGHDHVDLLVAKEAAFAERRSGFTPVRNGSKTRRIGRIALPSLQRSKEPTARNMSAEELFAQYKMLANDPTRLDAESLLDLVFDEHVPLCNSYRVGDLLRYPAITASIGRIATQRYLVLASQPSYQKRSYDGSIRKISASPSPGDFAYQLRMLEFGRRLRLPAVYFVDTFGASPTMAAEEQDTMRWISQSMANPQEYPYPVFAYDIGMIGSGGGMATMPLGDHMAMFEHGLACVAEPRSATSILYSTATPTDEQVKWTLKDMSATAADIKRLGLIDEIVPEFDDPRRTAAALRLSIVAANEQFRRYRPADLRKRRDRRARQMQGIPIAGMPKRRRRLA